jgi:hypothetical protein
MARLAITLACGDYDRTRALADGRVGVEGADLTMLTLSPEEILGLARDGIEPEDLFAPETRAGLAI